MHTFHFQRQRVGREALPERLRSAAARRARAIISRFSSLVPARASAKNPRRPRPPGAIFSRMGLQALALESAEAAAEWLHRRIREDWGFPDPPTMTMAGAVHFALSRQTLQLRLSRVSES